MKKLLIGTTALVAGGLIAGSAVAADLIPAPAPEIIDDGFTVSWNGYIRAGFYAGDTSCSTATGVACTVPTQQPLAPVDSHDTSVPVNAELQLFAEQTLANGLRVGGEIDFDIDNGTSSAVQVDELWMFIDGHFGQIRLGQKEGALDSLGGGSLPSWGAFSGSTDGPDISANGIAPGSLEDISGDAAKITYLSPSIAGVNLAVSFTPDPDSEVGNGFNLSNNGNAAPAVFGAPNATNLFVNEISFGANTTHTFGDMTLHVGGGFTTAEAEKNNLNLGDVNIWKIAGSLKTSHGGIGGWYSEREFDVIAATTNGTLMTTTTWGILGNIIHGDYTFGGGYTRADAEADNTGGVTAFTDQETDLWGVGVSKKMGTGFEVGANAYFEDQEGSYNRNAAGAAGLRGTDLDGWMGGVYAAIAF